MYELLIQHDSTAYMPPVKEEVKVTTERQISPECSNSALWTLESTLEMVIRFGSRMQMDKVYSMGLSFGLSEIVAIL